MKKMTCAEMRTINGGAKYTCTTRIWRTDLFTASGQRYQSWAKCNHVSYSKVALGYHFLFKHNGGSGCTYTVK